MFERQESWGKDMATRWMSLQAEILQTKEKVMKLSSLTTMASEIGLGSDDLKSFLRLHNSIGNVLYFDYTPELAENVITEPQWLVDKCKEVITHPEFIDQRTFIQEDIRQNLKRGFVTKDGLQKLWNSDDTDFLTNLMLNFDLFLPIVESSEENREYLIPCMLPSCEEKEDKVKAEDTTCLYDALQEAKCGDWFKVGEFDKLLAFFARSLDWKLCKNPSPSYGRAYFESEKYSFNIQLSLESTKTEDKERQGNQHFESSCTAEKIHLRKSHKKFSTVLHK